MRGSDQMPNARQDCTRPRGWPRGGGPRGRRAHQRRLDWDLPLLGMPARRLRGQRPDRGRTPGQPDGGLGELPDDRRRDRPPRRDPGRADRASSRSVAAGSDRYPRRTSCSSTWSPTPGSRCSPGSPSPRSDARRARAGPTGSSTCSSSASSSLALAINFALIAGYTCYVERTSFRPRSGGPSSRSCRPSSLGAARGRASSAPYVQVGTAAMALFGVVILIFQYLVGALLVSQQRADELELRAQPARRLPGRAALARCCARSTSATG